MEDAQNSELRVILAEIDPILAKDAQPDARCHAVAGDATMPETSKNGDTVENSTSEIFGHDDIRRGDIVKYIIEIT